MPLKKLVKAVAKKVVKKKVARPKAKDVPEGFVQVPKRIVNREATLVKRVNKNQTMTKKQIVDLGKVARINAEAKTVNKKNYISKEKLKTLSNLEESSYLRRAKRDLEGLGYYSDFFNKFPLRKRVKTPPPNKGIKSKKELSKDAIKRLEVKKSFREAMKMRKRKK